MCDIKLIHLIYFSGSLNLRSGGPAGYLANLKEGLTKIDPCDNISICFLTKTNEAKKGKGKREATLIKLIKKKVFSSKLIKSFYVNYISTGERKRVARIIKYLSKLGSAKFVNKDVREFVLNNKNLRSIHCHNIFDAAEVLSTLVSIGLREKIKVILTSHTPEAPSIELSNIMYESGLSEKYVRPFVDACEKFQEKIFSEVDALIFPSEEAMDPYRETIKNFDALINKTKILFLLTGTIGLKTNLTKKEARDKLGIKGDHFVVSFVGRHNHVKGYDLLCEVASKIFEKRLPIFFVVGGVQNDSFSSPINPQWRELGWVDPAIVLTASDLFVLPNRRTYFDLILLEAMSLGVNILASNTGGNKTVFNMTGAINLVNANPEEVAHAIIGQYEDSSLRIDEKSVRKWFDELFNERIFAKNYVDLMRCFYESEINKNL